VSAIRELPCPYCRAPIPLRRANFFPSRRYPIPCPACGAFALLPWKGVLIGVIVMIGVAVPGLLAAKPLFAPGMETVMDFVRAVAAFVAVSFVATWMASWACAQATRELAPYRARS
jgi:hypothetical protein